MAKKATKQRKGFKTVGVPLEIDKYDTLKKMADRNFRGMGAELAVIVGPILAKGVKS